MKMPATSAQMASLPLRVKAVLFDLDGTLVPSAPDLAAAVNYGYNHGRDVRELRPDGGS